MAGALDDKENLADWKAAMAMMGMVKSEPIFAGVASLMSKHGNPWNVPDGKKPLKALVEKAKTQGGSDDAADMGTAFHELTEVIDNGGKVPYLSPSLRPWLEAYWHEVRKHFEPVLVEPFVVCDPIKSAGSPDRYLRHKETGEIFCGDIKTGTREAQYPLKVTIQTAIGANAVMYDQLTGQRTPIECNREVGVLIHVPIKEDRPHVDLYWLDVARGWELAQLAYKVREAKTLPKLQRIA